MSEKTVICSLLRLTILFFFLFSFPALSGCVTSVSPGFVIPAPTPGFHWTYDRGVVYEDLGPATWYNAFGAQVEGRAVRLVVDGQPTILYVSPDYSGLLGARMQCFSWSEPEGCHPIRAMAWLPDGVPGIFGVSFLDGMPLEPADDGTVDVDRYAPVPGFNGSMVGDGLVVDLPKYRTLIPEPYVGPTDAWPASLRFRPGEAAPSEIQLRDRGFPFQLEEASTDAVPQRVEIVPDVHFPALEPRAASWPYESRQDHLPFPISEALEALRSDGIAVDDLVEALTGQPDGGFIGPYWDNPGQPTVDLRVQQSWKWDLTFDSPDQPPQRYQVRKIVYTSTGETSYESSLLEPPERDFTNTLDRSASVPLDEMYRFASEEAQASTVGFQILPFHDGTRLQTLIFRLWFKQDESGFGPGFSEAHMDVDALTGRLVIAILPDEAFDRVFGDL